MGDLLLPLARRDGWSSHEYLLGQQRFNDTGLRADDHAIPDLDMADCANLARKSYIIPKFRTP